MSQIHAVPASELFVLCCILRTPDLMEQAARHLPEADMFTQSNHRRIYHAMLGLHERGLSCDPSALDADGLFSLAMELLTSLPDELFLTAGNPGKAFDTNLQLIVEAYVKRQTALLLANGQAAGEVMQRLNSLIATGQDRMLSGAELSALVYAELTETQQRVKFPFRKINDATGGGMRKGELIVVGARQGGGKSAFLQNVALEVLQQGGSVLFATGEMSAKDLTGRWVTMLSGQAVLRDTAIDLPAANRALAQIHDWGKRLIVQELVNVATIERGLKEQTVDLVLVDYLQKLSPANPRLKSEYERVSEVSRHLDNLCQRYQVPLIVAAQFNRKAEGQQPSIADLRDSGQIEADADLVISLWKKPEEQTDAARVKVYVDILKNRNGYTVHNDPGHEYALWFDQPKFTFREAAWQTLR